MIPGETLLEFRERTTDSLSIVQDEKVIGYITWAPKHPVRVIFSCEAGLSSA